MDRLTKQAGDGFSIDCEKCPKRGQCNDSADCVEALSNRLAAYENTGLTPDEIVKMGMMFEDSKRYSGRLELKIKAYEDAEQAGQLLRLPFIAMIERSLQDGVMKPRRDQTHNGRYAVVYRDPSKWKSPLIDICGTHYNTQQAEARCAELHNKRKE